MKFQSFCHKWGMRFIGFMGNQNIFQNGVPENSFLIIDDMITNVREILTYCYSDSDGLFAQNN